MAKTPTGVKVIAVLYYIGAALAILGALGMLFGAGMMGTMMMGNSQGMLGGGMMAIGAVLMIGFAVLGIFVGRGLWNSQSWARIVAIIFAAIYFIMGAFALVGGAVGSGLFELVVHGTIGGYLLFNKKVIKAFK